MVEACRANGVALAVGDLDRNLPEYGTALALIEAGEIGEVSSITATGGSGTELSGGGCQVLSLVRLFAGDADVAWAIGWMANDAESDHDQGGAGYFRFVTGTEAILHRSADARGMGIEVAGSRGVIRVSANVVRMWRRPDEDPGAPAAERDSWQRLQPVDGVFPEGSIRNWNKGSRDGWGIPANRQAATVQELVTALDAGDAPSERRHQRPRGAGDGDRHPRISPAGACPGAAAAGRPQLAAAPQADAPASQETAPGPGVVPARAAQAPRYRGALIDDPRGDRRSGRRRSGRRSDVRCAQAAKHRVVAGVQRLQSQSVKIRGSRYHAVGQPRTV